MRNQESSDPILALGQESLIWRIFQEAGPKMCELESKARSKLGREAGEQHPSASAEMS